MPRITRRIFKFVRILELILLVVMLIVFLIHMTRMHPSNVDYAEYFDTSLVALTYVTLGGFVLVCIIDLACQYTMEPISQKLMCLFCIVAFILFMTVGIMSIKNYQRKISLKPAHHSNATHNTDLTPSTPNQSTQYMELNDTLSNNVQKQVNNGMFHGGDKDDGTYNRDSNSSGTKENRRGIQVPRQARNKPEETFAKKPGLMLFFGILSLSTSFVYLIDALVYIRSMCSNMDWHSRVYPVVPPTTSVTGDKGIFQKMVEIETLYRNKESHLGRSNSFEDNERQTYSFDNHALPYTFTKHDDFFEKSPKYSMRNAATENPYNVDFLTDKSMTIGQWPQRTNRDYETDLLDLDDIKSICILPDRDMDIIQDARENRPPARQASYLFYGASTSKEKHNRARAGNILNETFVRDFERQFNIVSAYPVLTYSNPSDNTSTNYEGSSSSMSKKDKMKLKKAQKKAEKLMKKERKAAEKRAKKEAKRQKSGKSKGGTSESPRGLNGDGVVVARDGTIMLPEGQALHPGDLEQIGTDGRIKSRSCCGSKWRKKTRRHLSKKPREKKKGPELVTIVQKGPEPVTIVQHEPAQQMPATIERVQSQETQILISPRVPSQENQLFLPTRVQSQENQLLVSTRVPSRELCHCGGYGNVTRRSYVQPEMQTLVQTLPPQDIHQQYTAVPPDGICCMCQKKIQRLSEQETMTRQNTTLLEVEEGKKICFQRRSSPKLRTIDSRTEYVKQGTIVDTHPPIIKQEENIQTVYSRTASPMTSQTVVTSILKTPHHGDCICEECLCVEALRQGSTIHAPYQGDGTLQSVYVRPELHSARHPDNCICAQCTCDTDDLIVTPSRSLITTSNAHHVYASPPQYVHVDGGNQTSRHGVAMRDVGIMVDTCKCCDCIKPVPIFQQEIIQEQVAPVVMSIARERERICCCKAVIKAPSITRVEVAKVFVTPRTRKIIEKTQVPLAMNVPHLRQTLWQSKVMTKTAVQSETKIRVNKDLLATMELRCQCGRSNPTEKSVVSRRQTFVEQAPTRMSVVDHAPTKLPCHCCTCNDQPTERVSVQASRSHLQSVFSPMQSNAPGLSSCNESNCGGTPRDFTGSMTQQSTWVQSASVPAHRVQSSENYLSARHVSIVQHPVNRTSVSMQPCDTECDAAPCSNPCSGRSSMLRASQQQVVMNAAVLQSSPMSPLAQSDYCDPECTANPCITPASRQPTTISSRQQLVLNASVLQSSPMSPLAQSDYCDPECTANPCSSPASRQQPTISSRQQLVMNASVLQSSPMSPLAQSDYCDPECTANPCSTPASRQPTTISSRQQLVMNAAAVLQGPPMARSSYCETERGSPSRQQSRIRTNASDEDIERMLDMINEPMAPRESQLSVHGSVHNSPVVEEPETLCFCDDIVESHPVEVPRDVNEYQIECSTRETTSARRSSSTAAKRPNRPASTSPVKSRGPKKCEGKSTFSSYGGTFHVSKDVAPISSRRDVSPKPYYHVHDICCQPIQESIPGGPCPCNIPANQPGTCPSPVAVCPLGHAHNIGAMSRRDGGGTTRNFFIYPVSVEREGVGDVAAATRISLPASPASSEEWVNVPGYMKPSARKTWAKQDSEDEFRLTTRDSDEGYRQTTRSEGDGGMPWLGRSRRIRPGNVQIEEVRDVAIEIDASNLMIPQVAEVKKVEPMQVATSWFMGSMHRR